MKMFDILVFLVLIILIASRAKKMITPPYAAVIGSVWMKTTS